ncbi:Hsp33 family molecular chaperone HslO [Pseudolactococcus chungangensis]|jgi:Disulfide bond chaperones of the HSP33 family|uniref:33 kDa chaperonin n=3 Tax=Pseudolactococcus chungangensis TaxID=451457 RepID=A0A1K2HBS2_9LACT|nr:Hsp33 family molecular chaperone HslO [Lactococcus chungangensis]NCB82452.1 Hsp33 family molecular chaperone HslO [Bacilli bacterium]MDD3015483.1 Hsp33 family molecular chaperone HslO [Lactococcus chungangensis]NLH36053.1 Hsp33 family molecular chaperone HslO [Lactococcus chungangensis]PCS04740.1 heat shock protein Hsp33 [Lactococcus chungangensis CAU 28 = DSM 22330]SFZ73722.1 molecular chaperone Hsp33 [Lactococcus chungangensis CAU 28 = DSM 22330]
MDKIIKTISNNGHFRAYALEATQTVSEAQKRHKTWSSSTVALGRTLIAAQILGANQKGDDTITVRVQSNGAITSIIAVADTRGNVKGYIKEPNVDYKRGSTGEVLVGDLVGQGWFSVVKDMGLKTPYTGQTPLISGEIGEDLAYYLTTSDQTPSAVGLNVLLNEDESVHVAGGFLVQVMPDAPEAEISDFEARIQKMPAISKLLRSHDHSKAILDAIYGQDQYKILEESPLAFHCDCSKERFAASIQGLGKIEVEKLITENHGAEVICQFCETVYNFSENDLKELI